MDGNSSLECFSPGTTARTECSRMTLFKHQDAQEDARGHQEQSLDDHGQPGPGEHTVVPTEFLIICLMSSHQQRKMESTRGQIRVVAASTSRGGRKRCTDRWEADQSRLVHGLD